MPPPSLAVLNRSLHNQDSVMNPSARASPQKPQANRAVRVARAMSLLRSSSGSSSESAVDSETPIRDHKCV